MNRTVGETVTLLEEYVARGDTESMVKLARLCALGHGIEQNSGRAHELLSDAAKNGHHLATLLMHFINNSIRTRCIELGGLGKLLDADVWLC